MKSLFQLCGSVCFPLSFLTSSSMCKEEEMKEEKSNKLYHEEREKLMLWSLSLCRIYRRGHTVQPVAGPQHTVVMETESHLC